jgi:hypothetical protein
MSQLSLIYDDDYRGNAVWAQLCAVMCDIVAEVGLKQAAADLDVQPSVLSHSLAERDGHRPKAEWVAKLALKPGGERIAAVLAEAQGFEIQRKRELTAQEKLDRLNAELDRNPAVAAAIRKAAGL